RRAAASQGDLAGRPRPHGVALCPNRFHVRNFLEPFPPRRCPPARYTESPRLLAEALLGVVENDAECVTIARAQRAHPMPELHAVAAALTCHGAAVYGKDHGVSLRKWHHRRT